MHRDLTSFSWSWRFWVRISVLAYWAFDRIDPNTNSRIEHITTIPASLESDQQNNAQIILYFSHYELGRFGKPRFRPWLADMGASCSHLLGTATEARSCPWNDNVERLLMIGGLPYEDKPNRDLKSRLSKLSIGSLIVLLLKIALHTTTLVRKPSSTFQLIAVIFVIQEFRISLYFHTFCSRCILRGEN